MAKKKKRTRSTYKSQVQVKNIATFTQSEKDNVFKWLANNWRKNYLLSFRDYVLAFSKVPSTYEVFTQLLYQGLFGKVTSDNVTHRELNKRFDYLYANYTKPFHDQLITNLEGLDALRSAHREAILDAVSFSLKLRDHGNCHLLDFAETGQYDKEQEIYFFGYLFLDPREQTIDKKIADIFQIEEFQRCAVKGFLQTCEDIHQYQERELNHIMDWYLYHLCIIDCPKSVRVILEGMKNYAQKGNAQRDFILQYYDDRMDTFNRMFEMYPELDFIEQGRFEHYELIGRFLEKLGITMQEVLNYMPLFSETEKGQQKDRTGNSGPKQFPVDNRTYRTAIMKAMIQLHREIIHHAVDVEWVNIWPNQLRQRRTAHTIGKYIAIQYKYQGEWWIIVESIEQGNAVYLWHGQDLDYGRQLLIKSKTYARQQSMVYRKNHSILRTDTYEIYRRILVEAGGIEVLG